MKEGRKEGERKDGMEGGRERAGEKEGGKEGKEGEKGRMEGWREGKEGGRKMMERGTRRRKKDTIKIDNRIKE